MLGYPHLRATHVMSFEESLANSSQSHTPLLQPPITLSQDKYTKFMELQAT